jgi:hypothetical protein
VVGCDYCRRNYHRVDAFLSSDGDLCGLAVAESAELQSSSPHLICPVGGLARGVRVRTTWPHCRPTILTVSPRPPATNRCCTTSPTPPQPARPYSMSSPRFGRAVRSSSPETCQTLLSLVAAAVQEADHSRHERFRFGSLNRPHLRWRVCAPKRWFASKPEIRHRDLGRPCPALSARRARQNKLGLASRS